MESDLGVDVTDSLDGLTALLVQVDFLLEEIGPGFLVSNEAACQDESLFGGRQLGQLGF